MHQKRLGTTELDILERRLAICVKNCATFRKVV